MYAIGLWSWWGKSLVNEGTLCLGWSDIMVCQQVEEMGTQL